MAKKVTIVDDTPWYVTWTCGHRALLEESLVAAAAFGWGRVLVVDYGCPDGGGDWVEQQKLGTVLRVAPRLLVDGTPLVSRACAVNAALRHLRGQRVLIGDPQLYPLAGSLSSVTRALDAHPGAVLAPRAPVKPAIGLLAAPANLLLSAGGYLQAYVGHGAEAPDLRLRLLRHNVPIVTVDLPIGVTSGLQVRMWGSAGLLDRRCWLLTGHTASSLALNNQPQAKILGLVA